MVVSSMKDREGNSIGIYEDRAQKLYVSKEYAENAKKRIEREWYFEDVRIIELDAAFVE